MVGVTLWLDAGGTVGFDTGGAVGFDTGTGTGGILLSSSNALLRSSCISSRSSLASLTHLAIRFALPNLASDNGVVSWFRRRRFGPPLLEVGLPFLTVLFSMARTVESTPSKTRLFITRCNMDRLRLLWSFRNLTRPTCYSWTATIPGATLLRSTRDTSRRQDRVLDRLGTVILCHLRRYLLGLRVTIMD